MSGSQRITYLHKVISSKSISHRKLEASGSGGTALVGGGASYQCITTTDRGAALLLKDYADKEAVIPNKSWKKYMLENIGSWHAHAEEVGYELEEEDIIFVRGTIKTSPRWELASFTTQGQNHEFGIHGQAGNIAKVGLKASSSNSAASGPSIRTGRYSDPSKESKRNQCIFFSYYKIKRRWFKFSKIEARAGPHRLPDSDDEPDPGTVITDIGIVPTPPKFHDPLDDVLDYILTNSNVKVAIACHDEIYSLHDTNRLPADFVAYLTESSPPIHVDEQGVGTLQASHMPSDTSSTPKSQPKGSTKSAMNSQKDVAIAIMGATGTGKSTFINLVSGGNLGVGDGLRSCTSEVTCSHTFELFGRRIVLVDTPGFDDTNKSETDILKMIAIHLSTTYEAGVRLSGVIYMHRISDSKAGGVYRRNLNMFRKLCGEETLRNILLVTTMWGLVDPELGAMREKELMTNDILFKPVLDKGAQMVRHDNTLQTAQAILMRLIQNHPEPLRIQRELVDEKKGIGETGAGEELAKELAAVMKKHKEDLTAVQKEIAEAVAAKDMEAQQELEETRKELMRHMEKVEQDRDRLSREHATEMEEEMKKIREQLAAEARESVRHQAELERVQREPENPPQQRGFFGGLIGAVGDFLGGLSGHL